LHMHSVYKLMNDYNSNVKVHYMYGSLVKLDKTIAGSIICL